MKLAGALAAWGSAAFDAALKRELESLQAHELPLQAGLAGASRVADQGFSVMVLGSGADAGQVRARVGVLFTGVEAGSCCADDPAPPGEQAEYCELRVVIDRHSAEAAIVLDEDGAAHG